MWKNEHEIFAALNKRLGDAGITLEIICVGGFVLSHNGMRATQDIDGFYETNALIESIVREIGDEFSINNDDELWLNNSVQNMNIKPEVTICELLYEFSNLKVYLAPLDYVAGMKLESCREQDIIDVAAIVKLMSIEDPNALKEIFKNYGFDGFDESLILEVFGEAYGMEWLEEYYIKHEEEILRGLTS